MSVVLTTNADVLREVDSCPGQCAGWPEDWPQHHNGINEPCDMVVGFCSCGAAHQRGEFLLLDGVLFRYGERVSAGRISFPRIQIVRKL